MGGGGGGGVGGELFTGQFLKAYECTAQKGFFHRKVFSPTNGLMISQS